MSIVRTAVLALACLLGSGVAALAQQSQPAPSYNIAFHVSDNNPATMNLVLNNVQNIVAELKSSGQSANIEVVTYGPGLHMLREDSSSVKTRIATMALETPSLTFAACGNTKVNQSKAEGKEVKLIGEAKVVPSGVFRLVELQSQGYAYIKP